VREYLGKWKYNLRQLELGARRKTADWNYTLDDGDPIGLLMPDIPEMRLQAGLLVLKARAEIAAGKYDEAARTLETGFSFSRQVGGGAFLISDLIGVACANQFLTCVLDWMERSDGPNLYWSLTALPRPLIDVRHGMDFEERVVELQFPDLADFSRLRTAEDWDAALARVRKEMERISKFEKGFKGLQPGSTSADPAAKSPDLPAAKKYLTEVARLPAARIEAMPPAEVLLRYLFGYFHELRDDMFKLTYLPPVPAQSLVAQARKKLESLPDTEPVILARFFLPALGGVIRSPLRLERNIAALRVIEALRLHAAATGHLPDKLSEVTVVPIPNDPGTEGPFEYQRDGATATLSSRIPGEPVINNGLRYRVKLRK
jgi:hypothetical protein